MPPADPAIDWREIAPEALKAEAQAPAMARTLRPFGAAGVGDEDLQWRGIMTDGNGRPAFLTHEDIRLLQAVECRARQPITLDPEASRRDATRLRKIAPR